MVTVIDEHDYVVPAIKRVATMLSEHGMNRAEIAANIAPDKMSDSRVRYIVVAAELLIKWRSEPT
jgi:hypothetical protein